MTEPQIMVSRFADLGVDRLYDLLRLRVDVFVVEQKCPYPELDGRDTDVQTEHLWLEVDQQVVATLRVLRGAQVWQIGRVATAQGHRGRGHAVRLVQAAIKRIGPHPIQIGAQTYLERWYEQFGFKRSGPDYLEDGIAHLPMVRVPQG